MQEILIDQSKILIDQDLLAEGAAPFPRPLAWWQQTMPIWVDVTETPDGYISLAPNGKVADGRVLELTPAARRKDLKQIARYLDGRRFLDFSDAVIEG